MLGLRVVQVDSPPVWHPDVTMYEVWEAAEKDVFVGHIYLDLFPRKGKYNHAAMGQLRSGYEREDGTREYPVAAMMANFPKPTLAVPSLLTHRNVVTLMHELGHVFHGLCAHTKWSSFHGTRVVADFIEAPSQMLENWAWEPEALRKFAVHHETGAPMPEDLVAKIAASKSKGLAGDILRQVFYGTYDLAIHNTVDGHIDVLQTYNDMQSNITMIGNGDAETCKVATFGHLVWGYSSMYYSYLWSRVFSADMYATRFKGNGINNSTTGMDYRTEILRPGGSRDAMESMVRFLGRQPNSRAFLESSGLQAD